MALQSSRGVLLPNYNRGMYRNVVEFRTYPVGLWRQFWHIGKFYLPYWSGQRTSFILKLRGVKGRTAYETGTSVSLHRYNPEQVENLAVTVTDSWVSHKVDGLAATSNNTTEYRFGLKNELDSALLVSARGHESDAVVFTVLGAVIAIIIGYIPKIISWAVGLISQSP